MKSDFFAIAFNADSVCLGINYYSKLEHASDIRPISEKVEKVIGQFIKIHMALNVLLESIRFRVALRPFQKHDRVLRTVREIVIKNPTFLSNLDLRSANGCDK